MKYACAMLLLALAPPAAYSASAPRLTPLPTLLAKPADQADARIKARVVEDLGNNKFRVEDGGKHIEVKGGPHWYHTLPLETGKSHTFDGELHVKNKDGERKIELKLVRVWRADGARLDVRANVETEPWKGIDKGKTGTPAVLVWRKS
ncbi:MAG: hypothetical protein LT080_08690 [Thiobacillus sp.]|nr:hypothetical protein [Thiobacillus sp.]